MRSHLEVSVSVNSESMLSHSVLPWQSYVALKKNETLSFVIICKDLKITMWDEINQGQKDKYVLYIHTILLLMYMILKDYIYRMWEENGVDLKHGK